MVEGRLGPVTLDLCPPCLSVWFDFGELSQVVQAGPAVLRRLCSRLSAGMAGNVTRSLSTGRCPVCRVPLSTVEFPSMPGIQMDGCTFCQGIWVSAQALSNIADRLAPAAPVAAAASPTPSPVAGVPTGNGAAAPPAARPNPAPPVPPAPPAPQVRPPQPVVAQPTAPRVPAAPGYPSRAPVPQRPAPSPMPAAAAKTSAPPKARESRTCPSCKQPNSGESAVCWACGGFLRVAGMVTCPACDGVMSREESDGVVFGVCDGCAGVWLEEGVLTRLRSQPGYQQEDLAYALSKRRPVRECRPASDYYCPNCRAPMFGIQLGMLTTELVSSCPECHASFLERGRLSDLLTGR